MSPVHAASGMPIWGRSTSGGESMYLIAVMTNGVGFVLLVTMAYLSWRSARLSASGRDHRISRLVRCTIQLVGAIAVLAVPLLAAGMAESRTGWVAEHYAGGSYDWNDVDGAEFSGPWLTITLGVLVVVAAGSWLATKTSSRRATTSREPGLGESG